MTSHECARDAWEPGQYEVFAALRDQPFFDLLALVERRPRMRVVDLGSGTGRLTLRLHAELGARETIGVERSAAMLAEARTLARPGLRFEAGDIAAFAPDQPFDLVFANASLQWVPDHRRLFARLTGAIADGGQLAVQMPANDDHASHVVAEEVAREEPFRSALGGFVRRSPVLAPDEYAALLHELGYARQHVRLQVYPLELAGGEQVVEWVQGSLLTDYRARLDPPAYERFLARYRARLLARLPGARPYLYTYKRLLLWAAR